MTFESFMREQYQWDEQFDMEPQYSQQDMESAFVAGYADHAGDMEKHGLICNKLGVERGRKETAEDICLLISCVPEPRLMNQAFVIGKIKEIYGIEI